MAGEPPSPNDGPARRSVRLERIALIHAQGPLLIRGSFLAAIVTAMFVHAQVDPATLSLWLAANVGLLAVREWNLRDYRRQAPEARRERASAYAARFTVGSVVNGVLWGLVPVLFAREDTTTLALLFAIHGGYTAASATTSVLWWPSFLAFVLPSSALFIGATLYFHFAALWSLAVAIALFRAAHRRPGDDADHEGAGEQHDRPVRRYPPGGSIALGVFTVPSCQVG